MKISPVNSTSFKRLHISKDKETRQSLRYIGWNKNILNKMNSSFAKINSKTGNTDATLKATHYIYQDREWWGINIWDKNNQYLGGCDITKKEPESYYISKFQALADYCKPSHVNSINDIFNKYQ